MALRPKQAIPMITAGDVAMAWMEAKGDPCPARASFIAGRVIPYLSSIWAPADRRTLARTSKTNGVRIYLLQSRWRVRQARHQTLVRLLLLKKRGFAGPRCCFPWLIESLMGVKLYFQYVNGGGLIAASFSGAD